MLDNKTPLWYYCKIMKGLFLGEKIKTKARQNVREFIYLKENTKKICYL